jgi:formamidopyrimidine-DNA glycosylase
LLAGLGVEPLTPGLRRALPEGWRRAAAGSLIKNLLMDGHRGRRVGNIYANEALFMAGIRPTRAAGRVSLARCEALVGAVKQVLGAAIEMGGTTLRDFVNQDGQPGYFRQSLWVYGREGEPCKACGAPLKGVRLGQRATVFCPACQPAR